MFRTLFRTLFPTTMRQLLLGLLQMGRQRVHAGPQLRIRHSAGQTLFHSPQGQKHSSDDSDDESDVDRWLHPPHPTGLKFRTTRRNARPRVANLRMPGKLSQFRQNQPPHLQEETGAQVRRPTVG